MDIGVIKKKGKGEELTFLGFPLGFAPVER
jgi:hypothetical protein